VPTFAAPGGPPAGPLARDAPNSDEPREPLRDRLPIDWELILGGNWLARIGILAVVVGMGFFLKLSFDNNWIGETGRVALGSLVCLAIDPGEHVVGTFELGERGVLCSRRRVCGGYGAGWVIQTGHRGTADLETLTRQPVGQLVPSRTGKRVTV